MRRILAVIILIIMIVGESGCKREQAEQFDPLAIESYWDIPGITRSEIDAVEELLQTYDSITYGHLTETEAFILPDGTKAGFIYSYCELLTKLFDFEFKPVLYDNWDELLREFEECTVDFIGELTQTPERLGRYYMTHAIAERSLRLFSLNDAREIKSEGDIAGQRIGFLAGTITAEYIKQAYKIHFETVEVTGYSDAVSKLEEGEIDAFVMESIADPYFLDYEHIESREFFRLVYSPVSMATANPELEPIITVMNKFLAAGGIDVLFDLYKQGEYEYASYRLHRSFTDAELRYIERLLESDESIPVGYEHDNYPYSFYNTAEDEFQGISVDVINEISRLTGIQFREETDKDTTWSAILEKLRNGEIAMVTQLLYSGARQGDFLWSEEPYATSNYALVSTSSAPALAVFQVIRAKVGYSSKTAYEDMFKEWFPEHNNYTAFDTQNDGFDALAGGEIDLLMTSEDMLLFQSNYRENPDFKVNIRLDAPVNSYFGFNKSNAMLCSIVSKTQEMVDTQAIQTSWMSKSFDYSVKLANQRTAYLGVFSACLMIALIAVILLLLKNYRLSGARRKAELEAQIASEAKSTFLAHMSHEIRTPLNAIIGMSDVARNTNDFHKKDESIDRIGSASRHLLGIINNILDMSKIESGKLELADTVFDLKDALGEVLSIIRQSCEDKGVELSTEIDKFNAVTLVGDKLRLNQTLINLLGNAVKFTDPGGKVTFRVKKMGENSKMISLRFMISDTGIGMTDEQMERLFVPFEQGDRNTAAKYGGTGLGLSISRNIVMMMGGDITVKSAPNMGTTFRFDLIFKKGEKAAGEDDGEPYIPDLRGRRIMLAEDVDINRVIVSELLAPTGAQIISAENGERAVELFTESPEGYYDLILMDVQMPVMDGYEATKSIRALSRQDAGEIPIISMTANAYKEDVELASSSGMNAYVSKPIDVSVLMKVLSEFLEPISGPDVLL